MGDVQERMDALALAVNSKLQTPNSKGGGDTEAVMRRGSIDWGGLVIVVLLLGVAVLLLLMGRHRLGSAIALGGFALWWGWSLLRDRGEVIRLRDEPPS
jgi:hypothetical protein